MSSLIIIPTYNEAKTLPTLIDAIVEQKIPELEILVVDDNSPDQTAVVVREHYPLDSSPIKVHILNREKKDGIGRAYIAGFQWALKYDYDTILQMDADYSHDPIYLKPMLACAETSADLVLGSRYVPGGGTKNWSLVRRIISRGGGWYARTVLSLSIRDLTGGFKCFHRKVLASIDLDSITTTGYAFQIEMTYRTLLAGFKVEEIPIIFCDRTIGQSKMSKNIFMEAVVKVFMLRIKHLQKTL